MIGQAAKAVGLISDEDVQAATYQQARAIVLLRHFNGQDFSKADASYGNNLKQKLDAFEAQLPGGRLNEADVIAEQQKLGTGRAPDNVPWFADMLEHLGKLPKKFSAPMMAAQSAARVKEAIDGGGRVSSVQEVLSNVDRFAPGKEGEPDYLQAAQSLNQMTNILIASIQENAELANKPEVQRALAAAEMLASQSLKRGAEAMKDAGRDDVAQQMREARKELRRDVRQQGKNASGILSNVLSTSVHVATLQKGLEAAAEHSPHKSEIMKLAATHLGRVSKLEVFGLKIPGTSVAAPESWLARISAKSPPVGAGQFRT